MTDPLADDRYRALEKSSPTTLAWEDSQDARTARRLRSSPLYPGIVEELSALRARPRSAPRFAGGRWFRIGLDAAAPIPTLLVSTRLGGAERPVFQPETLDGGVPLHAVPAPDGLRVACIYASTPSGHPRMRVVSVADGRSIGNVIDVGVAQQAVPGVSWEPFGRGLYYVAGPGRWERPALFYHEVGGTTGPDVREPVDVADVTARPQVSPDGRHVMLLTDTIVTPRATWLRGPDRTWRPFDSGRSARCHGVFVGDTYVAISTDGAPRGQLVRIILESGQESSCAVLVPESHCVLWDVIDTGDGLLLAGLDDDRVRLWSLTYEGVVVGELPMPGPGAVGVHAPARSPGSGVASVGESTVTFTHQTPARSAATYRIDVGARVLEVVEPAEIDLPHIRSRRMSVRVRDGTALPVQLTYRRDLDLGDPHPMVLTSYGALGQADLPGFVARFDPFVRAGGVHAWATVRGGSEFGDRWREGGRGHRLSVRTSDFCAVAQALIERGITTSDRLVVWGASAGGQLIADAFVRRPDLFAGAVALIPIADRLRFDQDAFGCEVVAREWGNPSDPGDAAALLAGSPYHAAIGGAACPPLLVVCTDEDDMAPSWHGRKLVARLSEYSDHFYLRVWRGIGHAEAAVGTPATSAEWLTFLMERAGLTPDGGPGQH